LANAEDPAPEVKSGESDATALAELTVPADAPPTVLVRLAPFEADPDELAPDEAPAEDAAPEVNTPDDAPDEAAPDVPAEAPEEVAPEEAMPEEEPEDVVPDKEAPEDVPVDAAPEALTDEVLGLILGFNKITGLLSAEAAEFAEDEDTSGEAIGP